MAQEIERVLEEEPLAPQPSTFSSCHQPSTSFLCHSEGAKATEESLKIAYKLKELYPEEVIEINRFRGQVSVIVKSTKIKEILAYLKEQQGFNHLQDLCGVDYAPEKPRFEVVYNLYSIWRRLHIRVRAKVEEENAEIDSVTDLWPGANWHERECFDMFGIRFIGHPDLRRILMPEDWNGYPLRKDYPLKGKELWIGFREIIESPSGEEKK
ncbi:NADH-quinone oxidoreductase subunit C [Thermodesulfovibrio sp.]|uniref:NADH-quinone oxidoreductase subunit C n=1 Tax=Thermodesulfovibrio sp. TaxID=2067987 RepID=UPI0030B7817F